MAKSSFSFQLQGHTPANRDAEVTLKNESTGAVVKRKPFLDGSLLVRDLEPGNYEVEVRHPNLTLPIERRRVRLFPQLAPTRVVIPIPPGLFKDSPIRDVPDADVGPVQQACEAIRSQLSPIAAKAPGEAIRSADWNTLVGAVADLAANVSQLAQLLAPRGHDHPEIADKIQEVQENLRRFAESYGRSLLELRREIETENLRKSVSDVLDLGAANADVRTLLLDRVQGLADDVQSETPRFTLKLAAAGGAVEDAVARLAQAQGANAEEFLSKPEVKKLLGAAQQYRQAGTQSRAESELQTYQRTTTTFGGKLGSATRK